MKRLRVCRRCLRGLTAYNDHNGYICIECRNRLKQDYKELEGDDDVIKNNKRCKEKTLT